MNNKRGISDIITTVLIVLLSLVAIAIVWVFISPLITKSTTQITQSQACLNVDLVVAGCKVNVLNSGNYNVTVTRNVGENISQVKIILYKADGSSSVPSNSSAPAELETKFYPITTSAGFVATKATVAAGITDASGTTNYCDASTPVTCTN